MTVFLHDTPDFGDLIEVLAGQMGIDPGLVEKDYWIMQALWGLQAGGFAFELKGGTSLSKGYQLIHRFSEDIDILIHPDGDLPVGRNHTKAAQAALCPAGLVRLRPSVPRSVAAHARSRLRSAREDGTAPGGVSVETDASRAPGRPGELRSQARPSAYFNYGKHRAQLGRSAVRAPEGLRRSPSGRNIYCLL